MGTLLIVSPRPVGFADGSGAARWVPIVLGAGVVLSLVTKYVPGLTRLIPMVVYLGLDAGNGVLRTVSPWLFGFADRVLVPHVAFGLLEVGAALLIKSTPAKESRPARG